MLFFPVSAALLCCAAENPLARVGIITDTHVTKKIQSCKSLKNALLLFKKHKVDMIVNCGDVAEKYDVQAYKNYRATVRSVYPQDKPKELFSFANHDRIGMSYEKAWPLVKKHLEIEHELYSSHQLAGYIFLTSTQNVKWKPYEKLISDACKSTPDKPVFLVDHVPGCATTSNTQTWGNGTTRRILNKYPQIVHLTGHVHGTFRNELNIWQGEYTTVNAGCTSQSWSGSLIGTVPERRRADEALLLEIYKDKLIFRRFDLVTNKEYKPDTPWLVPLPFDPKTAPYTAAKRKLVKAPEFASGAKITLKPDQKKCNFLELSFPEAKGEIYIYRLTLQRKNKAGQWENFSTQEIFGSFWLEENKRNICRHKISAGFFDTGKDYKLLLEPLNFGKVAGKALSSEFTMPEKAETTVVFESVDPMKELSFKSGLADGKTFRSKDGFYWNNAWNSRLILPDHVWKAPEKTRFRFTIDLEMKQPAWDRQWTIVLRNPKPLENANTRLVTPQGNSGVQRYVIEFSKRKAFFNYYLLIREGRAGAIRFDYVKVEKLK